MANLVLLIGRLGKDPELAYTPSQDPVTTLSLATNRRYKNKEGEWKEETEWHRVMVYGKRAEYIKNHAQKGSTLSVEGKLRTRKARSKKGEYLVTEVISQRINILTDKKNADVPKHTNEASPVIPDGDTPMTQEEVTKWASTVGSHKIITTDDLPF